MEEQSWYRAYIIGVLKRRDGGNRAVFERVQRAELMHEGRLAELNFLRYLHVFTGICRILGYAG